MPTVFAKPTESFKQLVLKAFVRAHIRASFAATDRPSRSRTCECSSPAAKPAITEANQSISIMATNESRRQAGLWSLFCDATKGARRAYPGGVAAPSHNGSSILAFRCRIPSKSKTRRLCKEYLQVLSMICSCRRSHNLDLRRWIRLPSLRLRLNSWMNSGAIRK
jgi:hypothetical protein